MCVCVCVSLSLCFASGRPVPPPHPSDSRSVAQVMDEQVGLELTNENVESVLDEIRPYLIGTGGGELHLDDIDGPIVKVKLTGPAAEVMTVRVAITQKLRERIPTVAAVQLL